MTTASNISSSRWFTPFLSGVAVALVFLITNACQKATLLPWTEPQRIIVRNATDVDLVYVHLAPYTAHSRMGTRYAAVSPVPKGVSQEAARATDAPALPKKVIVKFQPVTGREIIQVVDIAQAIRRGSGPDRALVFLIRRDYHVEAFLE